MDLDLQYEDLDLDLDSGGKDLDLDLDLNFEDLTTSLPINRRLSQSAELLDAVKARKLAYYGHTMRKEDNLQGTIPGAHRRGRPRTAWMDNFKTWTGLPVDESMTEDREGRKYVLIVWPLANPLIDDG